MATFQMIFARFCELTALMILVSCCFSGNSQNASTDVRYNFRGDLISKSPSANPVPAIISQPQPEWSPNGRSVSFSASIGGQGPFAYQWQFNGANIPGATNDTLFIAAVTSANEGFYSVIVSNAFGVVTSAKAALGTLTLGGVLDAPQLSWLSRGHAAWFPDTQESYDGVAAAHSGSLNASEESWMETTVVGPGSLSFQWKVSSEPGDYLRFYVNGVLQVGSISGETAWGRRIFVLGAGAQKLRWVYVKNATSTGGQDCAWVDRVTFVSSNGAPVIFIPPDSVSVTEGHPTVFSVGAVGASPLSYQWQKSGINLPGATGENLSFSSVLHSDGGPYRVVVTNVFGGVVSEMAALRVRVLPAIIAQPQGRTVTTAGTRMTFSVGVTGTGPFQYQWYLDGYPIAGANEFALVIPSVTSAHEGDYNVKVSNDAGYVYSAIASLLVHLPPAFTIQPEDGDVDSGTDFVFITATASGTSVDYQWYKDGVALAGENSDFYEIIGAQTNQAGNYSVTASNIYGVSLSTNALLTVWQTPPYILLDPYDATVWEGGSVAFYADATGSKPLCYQWQKDNVDIAGATNLDFSLPAAQTNDAGHYTMVVSNEFGVAVSETALLTVIPGAPTIYSQPLPQSVIEGGFASFSVTANGVPPLAYQWRRNGTSILGATYDTYSLQGVQTNQAGSYTVVVTNSFGSVVSSNALLSVSPALPLPEALDTTNLIWTTGGNATWIGQTNVSQDGVDAGQSGSIAAYGQTWMETTVTGPGTLTFWWKVSSESTYDPLAFWTNGTLRASISGNVDWQLQTFSLGNGPQTLRWQYSKDGSVSTGQDRGWVDGINYTVVSGPPAIATQPVSQTVVTGSNATFSVGATGSTPLLYQWRKDNTNLAGATSMTCTITNVQAGDAGLYSVVVSNSISSTTSSNGQLTVIQVPIPPELQIVSLTTNNAQIVDHNALTGDDRGGIAVSTTRVMITGDNATARFSATDLSGGAGLGRRIDGLCANLATDTVYALGNGTNELTSGGGTATTLIELAGDTGVPTGNLVSLSQAITLPSSGNGIFSGLGRVLIYNGTQVYDIFLPSGVVVGRGTMARPAWSFSESWSVWGVAESFGGGLYLTYARSGSPVTTIERARVPDGAITPLATFANLSDLASFTLSPSRSRWYFHYESGGQFGGSAETLGYADANINVGTSNPPVVYVQPKSQTVSAGTNATFEVTASGNFPLHYQWRKEAADIVNATNATYAINSVSSNHAGEYSVFITNQFGNATSSNATLIVNLVPPTITSHPQGQAIIQGAGVSFTVAATGSTPLAYQWRKDGTNVTGATASQYTLASVQGSQAGVYSAAVSNAFGGVLSSNAILSVLTFADGLDNTNLAWTVGGNISWFLQTNVTHDGVDAVQSGSITNSQESWIETGVAGPANLGFWWRVSSETNYDFLEFYINGELQTGRISGESGWQQKAISLGDGSQTLRWRYVKDDIVTMGQDHAWLDQISVSAAGGPVTILIQPQNKTVLPGASASFAVSASGASALTYQWRSNGVPINGAIARIYTVSNAQSAATYSVLVSNSFGSLPSSGAALTVQPALSLAEAVDATNLTWTTTSGRPWIGQRVVTHDGIDAGQSAALAPDQDSWMETTVAGPALLSFWWKVSSESIFDYLEFSINGTPQSGRISGEVDWQQNMFTLGNGSQTLRWRYVKDGNVSIGQDQAWVDSISLGTLNPSPQIQSGGPRFGFTNSLFGFNILGSPGQVVVVEASTNLVAWTAISTNTLVGTAFYYVDTASPTKLRRFYRLRLGGSVVAPPVIMSGSPRFTSGKFGFDINGASGSVVVIEVCTNLQTGGWTPLFTNTLAGSPLYFADPQSGTQGRRFYRARVQ